MTTSSHSSNESLDGSVAEGYNERGSPPSATLHVHIHTLGDQPTQPLSVEYAGEWIPNGSSLIALEYVLRLEPDEKDNRLEKPPSPKDTGWPDGKDKPILERDIGYISHPTAISRYLVDWINSFSQSRPIQVFITKKEKLEGENPPWHFPSGRIRTQPPRGPRTRSRSQSQRSGQSARSSPYPPRRPSSNRASPVTPTSIRPLVGDSDTSAGVNPPNHPRGPNLHIDTPQSPAISPPHHSLAADGCIDPAQLTTPTSANEGHTTGATPLAAFPHGFDLSDIDPALFAEPISNTAEGVNHGQDQGHGPTQPPRETGHNDDGIFDLIYISDSDTKDNAKEEAAGE